MSGRAAALVSLTVLLGFAGGHAPWALVVAGAAAWLLLRGADAAIERLTRRRPARPRRRPVVVRRPVVLLRWPAPPLAAGAAGRAPPRESVGLAH